MLQRRRRAAPERLQSQSGDSSVISAFSAPQLRTSPAAAAGRLIYFWFVALGVFSICNVTNK